MEPKLLEKLCSLCCRKFLCEDDGDVRAKEEYHRLFPDSDWEERQVICDDCWQLVKPSKPWYRSH